MQVHEMIQGVDEGTDIGNRAQKEVDAIKENSATSVGQATQEESSNGKQNKEKECGVEVCLINLNTEIT